jgi:hypothetical protein
MIFPCILCEGAEGTEGGGKARGEDSPLHNTTTRGTTSSPRSYFFRLRLRCLSAWTTSFRSTCIPFRVRTASM